MKRLALTLVGVIFASAGQQNSAEVTTHDQTLTFKTAVNMVTVPVVIRDSNGRAVGGLKQEDFQVYDRGKLQTISSFKAEKSEGPDVMVAVEHAKEAPDLEVVAPKIPEAVQPERFIAYLFDDAHASINDLAMARDAADRHMKKSLGPKTRAAVFTTSGQNMLDFTSDRDQLHAALFRLQPHPITTDQSYHDCPDLTYFWADRIRNQNDQEAVQMAAIDALACGAFNMEDAGRMVRPAVARAIARQEHESSVSLGVVRGLVQRLSVMPGQRTIVLSSPGFLTLIGSKEAESFIIDKAIRANVVINALDVRGLATETKDVSRPSIATSSLPVPLAQYEQYRQAADHEVFKLREDVMGELAAGTGGTFYHNSNDLDTGFDRVAGNPEYIYKLGFAPRDLKLDGSLHALKVSLVANPHHYDLDARRSYTAPKRLDDPAEQAKQEIQDALFSRDELHDIPLDLHTEYFKAPQGIAKVTVITHVDLKALKLRKTGGRSHDDLTVTAGLFDNNGNYVAGIQRGVELHLKDDTFDKWMANGIQVRSNLEVKPGTYLVRIVVRDSEGQLMATRNGSIDIP